MTQLKPGEEPALEKAQPVGERFDTPAVLTLTAAHAGHDIYPAFLAPLLPLLISKFGLPLALAGVLPSVFKAGSLAQPFAPPISPAGDRRSYSQVWRCRCTRWRGRWAPW